MTSKLPQTPRPSAIRTFLIADIRGWTRFTRELGDEAASRLAAKFAQIVAEGVEAWGGQLLELRGDEAMCAFSSARSALRCAVELQEAFADESAMAPELPLRVGIGLDAGEAVPVDDGYRGTALNVAARLCSVAAAGEVLTTASLVHLAGRMEGLAFAELDAKPMKGFEEPVPALLVDSAAPHEHDDEPASVTPASPPALPSELDALVPLVGRESDLRWLAWHWRRARHGHGGAVAISGVTGIGRTRLVSELASQAHRDGASVAYGIGRADLVVIDDVETLPERRGEELARLITELETRRLVVLTLHEPLSESIVLRFPIVAQSEGRHRRLEPIGLDAVADIGRLYLDDPEVDVPAHLLHEESRGIPAAVHRVASQWAGSAARRRLGESARRTSRERRDLRAAEEAMISDVERLELTRERTRLFVPDLEPEADAVRPAPRAVCPYKGLAAFEATDAEYYFGRDRLVAELIARMVGSAFIGLIGASGSGKSSALQAGLLPALASGVIPGSDEWIQVQTRPGDHPMRELRRALHRSLTHPPADDAAPAELLESALGDLAPAQRLLLVVDQFEELFTSVTEERERAEFIDFLTEQRPGMKVLVAVRADHYERCAAYPRLARLIGSDQVLVGPLTEAEIAAIIRHPAERVGLRVEIELVEALVDDVETEPGGLPLLSTALLELWEARDGDRLTLSAYRATGGVRGAVARLAESVFQRLDIEEQDEARAVFLRLAGESVDRVLARRRVPLAELDLDAAPRHASVVSALTHGRLLTADEGYVEVAHEALLREWPRLRSWIEEDSSGRELRLHLMSAARTWDGGGREQGDLYRGARLAATLDWSAHHENELNSVERAFIAASHTAAERDADRQRRANRRLRGLLAGTAAMLLVTAGAGALAMAQSRAADEQRQLADQHASVAESEARRAEEQAILAQSRELAQSAIAVLDEDPELSMLLAIEAIELGSDLAPDAVTTLHHAVQAARKVANFDVGSPAAVTVPEGRGAHFTADGSRLLVPRSTRSFDVFEVGTTSVIETYGPLHPDELPHVLNLAVTEDERLAAMTGEDGIVRIWNLVDGSEQQLHAPGFGSPHSPAFSPDGRLLAVVTYETEDRNPIALIVTLWDLETGSELRRLEPDHLFEDLELYNVRVLFHPDGQRVLLASCDCLPEGGLRWWDINSGSISDNLVTGVPLSAVAISPDGRLIVTGDADRRVLLWDAETGDQIRSFRGHRDIVHGVSFSPDGKTIASTAADSTIRVWDTESGADPSGVELMSLRIAGLTSFVSLSEDGSHLAAVTTENSAHIWDVSRQRAAEVSSLDLGWTRAMSIDVAGGFIAAMGRECSARFCVGDVVVHDMASGENRMIEGIAGLGIALSPDGSGLWAQHAEKGEDRGRWWGPITRYGTGDLLRQHTLADICPFSFPRQGETACGEPPATPWDEEVVRIAVSPDGEVIAVVGNSPALSLWEGSTGTLLGVIPIGWLAPGHYPNLGLGFSPDNELLAVATFGPMPEVVVVRTQSLLDADPGRLEALSDEIQALGEDGAAEGASTTRESLMAELDAALGVVQRFQIDAWGVGFSTNSDNLAVASFEGSRVYDLDSGAQRYQLRESWGIDVSGDGTRLATLDTDGSARIWEFGSGRELQVIPAVTEGLGDFEGAIRFANDDRHIVVTDAGVVKVLTLDVDELVEIAKSRLTRDFTDDECRKYLHLESCSVRALRN